ncbi:MAG: cation-translocating P-type ATPase [Candidatus Nitrospinota bacterium M3_3B_026]
MADTQETAPMPSLAQTRVDWSALDVPTLEDLLKTSEKGLTEAEAAERLRIYGPNQLPRKPPPSLREILLRQFKSPLIYILAIAAVVSMAIGELTDTAFIAVVLLLNAAIGGYQEWRAERSAQALQKLLRIRATVERDGEIKEISAEEIAPGDVVWLESGGRVPADMRLLMTHGLEVDESLLTGESIPVLKDAKASLDAATPLADQRNMAYAGSIVTRGRGKGVVVATGMATAVGQLALDVVGRPAGKPPLIVRMERFSKTVAVIVLLAAVVVGLVGVFGRGYGVGQMFMFGVALAVSAIPEGLPVALTVALAVATTRMARRGIIVRRLAAVEGLGSCELIASDKTGTLTKNELTVREIMLSDGRALPVTGEGFTPEGYALEGDRKIRSGQIPLLDRLALAAALCNEADLHMKNSEWVWRGDPTDIALLSLAGKLGLDHEEAFERYPQVNEIPYEPEHKFAATYHEAGGETHIFIKGAPERVVTMLRDGGDRSFNEDFLRAAEKMAGKGYRVLALAAGRAPAGLEPEQAPPEPSDLEFLGFVGMMDPLRHGVREAIQESHGAGISVIMITGDHPVTAFAIARDLGLAEGPEEVVTGTDLAGKAPEELDEIVRTKRVFARITSRQKLEIVEAARRGGMFVAVTGDGVNDAPALRAANIGVAMGKAGTDVAREAAELVISDDNFATIVAGVEEGRIAYDNVRKVIYLLVSTGAAEVIMVTMAVAAGMPIPLLPAQLLWLNLVTNGIQDVALAFEPGEGDVLKRKPRPQRERIFNRLMIERTAVAAAVMGLVGFGLFWWALRAGWAEDSARNALLLLMVLFENIHIANCRSETKSAFRIPLFSNPILLFGVAAAFTLHVMMMYAPMGHAALRTEPASAATWAAALILALTVLAAMEIHKRSWAARTNAKG